VPHKFGTSLCLILQRERLVRMQPTKGSFFLRDGGRVVPLRIDCLELPWRDALADISCIPEGVYPMRWTHSPRFGIKTWELMDVPGRTAIRIHTGNYAGVQVSDSNGCLLPCMRWGDINKDGVIDGLSSAVALRQLEAVLEPHKHDGIDIDVRWAVDLMDGTKKGTG